MRIASVANGYDSFVADAASAMRARLGDRSRPLSSDAQIQGMDRWLLSDFIRHDLGYRGIRVDQQVSQGDLMREWLSSQCNGAGEIMVSEAGSSATGGVGRMPTLLGSVMGSIHLDPIQNEDITFPQWCFKLEDLPDFNPRTINTSIFAGRLDDNMTGADPKKVEVDEEATWIRPVFGNKSAEWTFVEQENNSFDRLREISEGGRFMCDDKMEEKAVNLLTSTISINGPDGSVAVSTARGNLIDTGDSAPPDVDQFEKMQMALRSQVDKKGNNAGSGLGFVLHSYHHEIVLKKLLPKSVIIVNGVFTPTTVTNVNPFAGGEDEVRRIYVPRLDKTGKKYYYGLSRKRRAIGFGYKRGFGPGGKRRIVFNPRNGNVEFIYEQAGAVVLLTSQYITINKSGEA